MNIEDMVIELEKYLEDAGLEGAREKILNSKGDDEIRTLYEAIAGDLDKY